MSDNVSVDKRRYARFEILECALVYPDGHTEAVRAVVVDIGLGGIQLRSRERLPVDRLCHLQIGGGPGQSPIELKGEVRYSRPIEGSELVASGFRFLPATHEERLAVAEYVHGVFVRQADELAN